MLFWNSYSHYSVLLLLLWPDDTHDGFLRCLQQEWCQSFKIFIQYFDWNMRMAISSLELTNTWTVSWTRERLFWSVFLNRKEFGKTYKMCVQNEESEISQGKRSWRGGGGEWHHHLHGDVGHFESAHILYLTSITTSGIQVHVFQIHFGLVRFRDLQ